jgi:hypothetical protein
MMVKTKNYRAKVVCKIQDHDADCHNPINKFIVEIGEGQDDEIMAYHKLCDYIETQEDQDINPEEPQWEFSSIEGHVCPIKKGKKDHKGYSYNVLVKWEDGSQTFEALDTLAADDPITLAIYARENNLLDTPGWTPA